MGYWADVNKLKKMSEKANRVLARVLEEADKMPADVRGLFLDRIWRGIHEHRFGKPTAPSKAEKPNGPSWPPNVRRAAMRALLRRAEQVVALGPDALLSTIEVRAEHAESEAAFRVAMGAMAVDGARLEAVLCEVARLARAQEEAQEG